MNASAAIFKTVIVVTVSLAVLLLAVFPFQEPGTGPHVVSILAFAVQGVIIAIAAAGLYFGWRPFRFLDPE